MRNKARRLTIALVHLDRIRLANQNKKGINASEHILMYALDDGQYHSQQEISEKWLIPKTTLNTIVKKWEKDGKLILSPIPEAKREMQICLTKKGKKYAHEMMSDIYTVEEIALQKTLDRYPESFIEAIEYLGTALQETYDERYPRQ